MNVLFSTADEFKNVFHSLNVWHKSKSIRKCLGKVCVCYKSYNIYKDPKIEGDARGCRFLLL